MGRAAAEKAARTVDAAELTRQLERLYLSVVEGRGVPVEWSPSRDEVDAFEAEYKRRLQAEFRRLTDAEQREVAAERLRERAVWALSALRRMDRHQLGNAYWLGRRLLRVPTQR
jgi:hypothetical protein